MRALSPGRAFSFIDPRDELAALINTKANELYHNLNAIEVEKVGFDVMGKAYFEGHHTGNRLIFSLQNSSAIIYGAVKKSGRPVSESNFIDYGAGLGTLFLLAGMLGFKAVYYADLLPEWAGNGKKLCAQLNIPIAGYIVGNIDELIRYGKANNIHFDILASRNVIEHIYDLGDFYGKLHRSGLTSMFYSTTTANYHNLAMRIKHHLLHRRLERNIYIAQRSAYIKELAPGITAADLDKLVEITRGRAFDDFTNAVQAFLSKKNVAPVPYLSTNTCDCSNGVWAEHIIPKKAYAGILEATGFNMEYSAGFWDTHYKYAALNGLTRLFNKVIRLSGKKGYWLSPFINVVATRK